MRAKIARMRLRERSKAVLVTKEFLRARTSRASSERPAPLRIDVKSIDDTSNFDEFPDVPVEISKREFL